MSTIYRAAITITRKQPYIDWANSFDDGGPQLTEDLARDRRAVYLVTESDRPELSPLVDEFWEDIFEEELAAWMENENDWPAPRTREMFDAWFDAELTDSVFDLVPEQPLTQTDVELGDLDYAIHHCAWCDLDLEPEAGRFVGFALEGRERVSHREGLVLSLPIDEERVVHGVLSQADSDEARAGEDLVFRVCTSRCEKGLRKAVPKALRKADWYQDEP